MARKKRWRAKTLPDRRHHWRDLSNYGREEDLIQHEPPAVQAVIVDICRRYKVTIPQLLSHETPAHLRRARSEAVYLLAHGLRCGPSEIARALNRTKDGFSKSVQLAERRMREDPEFAAQTTAALQTLQQSQSATGLPVTVTERAPAPELSLTREMCRALKIICHNDPIAMRSVLDKYGPARWSRHRRLFYYVLRELLHYPWKAIGQRLDRDHTTILKAAQLFAMDLRDNPSVAAWATPLIRAIENRCLNPAELRVFCSDWIEIECEGAE